MFAESPGVDLTPLGGLDLTRRFRGIELRDVTLPPPPAPVTRAAADLAGAAS